MDIAEKLRRLREMKNLSQGDIENRTGLKRSYVSRVEHGHTVPSVETLEKLSRGLEVPLYQLFYDGETAPPDALPPNGHAGWPSGRKSTRLFTQFRQALARMSDGDREILLFVAGKMANHTPRKHA